MRADLHGPHQAVTTARPWTLLDAHRMQDKSENDEDEEEDEDDEGDYEEEEEGEGEGEEVGVLQE